MPNVQAIVGPGGANMGAATPTHAVLADYASGDVTFIRPSVLLLSAAGTVNVVTLGGETVALPMQQGYNPILVKQVLQSGTDVGITIYGLS